MRRTQSKVTARGRSAFTLLELLVVIGIIVVVGGVTLVAVKALAKDARYTSSVNTVKAALGQARGLAMKNNSNVVVVFRPIPRGTDGQVLETVFAEWRGDTVAVIVTGLPTRIVDRFVIVNGVPTQEMSRGIKIAGPRYGGDNDSVWQTQSEVLRVVNNGETAGRLNGVMFNAAGEVVTQNAATDSNRIFIDFNNDGFQRIAGVDYAYPADILSPNDFNIFHFLQTAWNDENFIELVPFVAVYDDDQAREFKGDGDWNDFPTWESEITAYVNEFSDRIHFNRYTGVITK